MMCRSKGSHCRKKEPSKSRSNFTTNEEKLIKETYEKFGKGAIHILSQQLPNHTPRAIREKYQNQLCSTVKKEFTPEEDQLILEYHDSVGNKWLEISKRFPGSTASIIKARFHKLEKNISKNISNYSKESKNISDIMEPDTAELFDAFNELDYNFTNFITEDESIWYL